MAISFVTWRRERLPLPFVELGSAHFWSLGASLHRVDDEFVLSVLRDVADASTVALGLTATQIDEVQALLPVRDPKAVLAWLRALDLDQNEVVGRSGDEFVRACLDDGWLGETAAVDGAEVHSLRYVIEGRDPPAQAHD